MKTPRLPPIVMAELEGLPWSIEGGRKHWQLRIAGRLVGVFSYGPPSERSDRLSLLLRAAVRRWKEDRHAA